MCVRGFWLILKYKSIVEKTVRMRSGLKRPTPVGPANASASPAPKNGAKSSSEPAPENDPIAVTIQQREALGGLNNQITDLEAQKKKFKVYRAPRLAFKGTNFSDFVGETSSSAPDKRPATAAGVVKSRSVMKPPSSAASSRIGAGAKASGAKKTEESSVSANENLDGVDDPIAQAVQDRIKAGGLNTQIKELDAKKQKITVFSAPKHVVKAGGSALLTFVEGDAAGSNNRTPAKQGSSAKISSPSPMKKRPSTTAGGLRQSGISLKSMKGSAGRDVPVTSQLDGDLSEDPIAQSVACRIKLGGMGSTVSDADAKKQNLPIFKVAKHPTLKGGALLDIAGPAAPPSPKKASSMAAKNPSGFKGLKAPTKLASAVKAPSQKQGAGGVDLGPAVSQDEDPIAASLKARITAGGLNS